MVVLTLFVVGVMCLVFKSTRTLGIFGITFLLLLYPVAFMSFLVVACFFFFIHYKLSRRNLNVHEQPKLPD